MNDRQLIANVPNGFYFVNRHFRKNSWVNVQDIPDFISINLFRSSLSGPETKILVSTNTQSIDISLYHIQQIGRKTYLLLVTRSSLDYYFYAKFYDSKKERNIYNFHFLLSWFNEKLITFTVDKSKPKKDSFLNNDKEFVNTCWICVVSNDLLFDINKKGQALKIRDPEGF